MWRWVSMLRCSISSSVRERNLGDGGAVSSWRMEPASRWRTPTCLAAPRLSQSGVFWVAEMTLRRFRAFLGLLMTLWRTGNCSSFALDGSS